MKDLGMKDQVALKFSVISLRSATVILSPLDDIWKEVRGYAKETLDGVM